MPPARLLLHAAALGIAVLLAAAPARAGTFEHGFSLFQQQDYGAALRAWAPLAESGDARAQYWVGFLYENGTVDGAVARDRERALTWYLLATVGGNGLADARGRRLYDRMAPDAIDRAVDGARRWVARHPRRHFAAPIP